MMAQARAIAATTRGGCLIQSMSLVQNSFMSILRRKSWTEKVPEEINWTGAYTYTGQHAWGGKGQESLFWYSFCGRLRRRNNESRTHQGNILLFRRNA
jgi:hypothetical protein